MVRRKWAIATESRELSLAGTRKRWFRGGRGGRGGRRLGKGGRREKREWSIEWVEKRKWERGGRRELRSSFRSLILLLIKVNPTVRGDPEEDESVGRGER